MPPSPAPAPIPESCEVRLHRDPAEVGLEESVLLEAAALLETGRQEGRHRGGQVYVSRHGLPVLEVACGEASPGVPMTPDSLTPWFSACKPITAVAIAQLVGQRSVDLDDRVVRYLPDFRHGKETCTLRHILTHQGGFPGAVQGLGGDWDETIARICAYPADYPPGTKAGYHAASGWYILGEVLRRVDGRMIDRYIAEEIFAPLGIEDAGMGIPREKQAALGDRMAQVHLGHTEREHFASEAFVERFNSAEDIALVNPSGGARGPARDLGRVYDCLLAKGAVDSEQPDGPRILSAAMVEVFTACHRWGVPDLTLMGAPLAWGLGFGLHGNADVHRGYSRRIFTHSGMVSTVAVGDPETGLACVAITTGLLDPMTNARRLRDLTGTAVRALREMV